MKGCGLNHEFAYVRRTAKHLKETQYNIECEIKFMTNINSCLSLIVLCD